LLGARAAFIESETLMSHTDLSLQFLQHFLGLGSPLTRRYRSFSRTGVPGYGDPSSAITSGEMGIRREKTPRYSIPSALIAEAVQAHAECLAACSSHCVTVNISEPRRMPQRAADGVRVSLAG